MFSLILPFYIPVGNRIGNFVENNLSIDRALDTMISVEKPTCPQGFCINSEKNDVYMFNDICQPDQFTKAGCEKCVEKVECQFTK